MIEVSKNKYKFFISLLEKLESNKVLSQEERERLHSSVSASSFDWRKFAKLSFWLSVISFLLVLGAVFRDFLPPLFNFFSFLLTGCIALSACFYGLSYHFRKRSPKRVFMNEALLFLGVNLTSVSIFLFLYKLELPVSEDILSVSNIALYGVVGFIFRSKFIWLFSLLSLGQFLGIKTFYLSGMYGLKLNPSIAVLCCGVLLLGVLIACRSHHLVQPFYGVTRNVGLLYVFISLWILSIFGIIGMDPLYYSSKYMELFVFSILFGVASLVAIYVGCKLGESAYTGFGVTFLFINMYTRYTEFFWDSLSFIAFFSILAISFWIIGVKSEAIWIRSKNLFSPVN